MRKLYALLAGLCIGLACTPAMAQTPTPDVANFTYTIDQANQNVSFTNTSVIGAAPGTRRAFWSFGDGSGQWTLPLQGTQHHYNSPGTYTVCLKIYRYRTSAGDSILSAQICKTIVIETICRADFEKLPVTVASTPLGVTFKALPWHAQNKRPVMICWEFGDGKDTCIQYSNTNPGPYLVHHRYAVPGIYEVCVKILYEGGCVAKKCKEIRIGRPDICKADFERIPVPAGSPHLTAFRALPDHNNNKKPVKICWSFGDGKDTCINYPANYNGPYTVTHRYLQPGSYEVCVKIFYAGGCEARKCRLVSIPPVETCKADFERLPITTTNNPLQVSFKALPWHSQNKRPVRICWDFGDGKDTCIQYSNTNPGPYVVHHRYAEPGKYEVCVKIFYQGGCEAKNCKPIQVGRPDECKADFERIPVTANIPYLTGFRALPGHNNNKKPIKICWSFGDGKDTCINYPANYNGLYTVTHRYLRPGSYEVCVKILYAGGCEAKQCRLITIPPVDPTVCKVKLFEIVPSVNSLVRGFFANPESIPNRRPERICWYFGDGTDTCVMINPVSTTPLPFYFIRHTYPGPGVYRACVKILFSGGCIAYDCVEVVIRPSSSVCGGFMVDSLVSPRTYAFKGFAIHNRNDEAIGYRWSFGDGTGASGREVTHTYANGGNYEVCLSIKTRLGCETKICKTVRVPGNNQPALQLSPNPVINTLNVAFFSGFTEQVNIKIMTANGTPVRTYSRWVTAGANNWTFELGGLVAGIYSFSVQSPNQHASAIFIKQ